MESLTLIVKVTRRCNLRCVYCNDWRPNTAPVMSMQTLDRTLVTALTDPASTMAVIAWHGGEPTLAPLEFYEYAVRRQRELTAEHGRLVANVVQTNGVSLSDRWLDFIAANNFRVGISLDGPQELNDRMRPTVSGRGSFRAVRATMDKMLDRGIPFATLMVLSQEMIELGAERIWRFIEDEGLTDVDLIPARPPNTPEHETVSPQAVKFSAGEASDRWSEFLCDLFDRWWTSKRPVRITTMDSVVRRVLGASSVGCVTSGDCMGRFFGIEPTGEVYVCGLYEDLSDFVIGTVHGDTFAQMRQHPSYLQTVSDNDQRLADHRNCPGFDICAGGCPHDYHLSRQYLGPDAYANCCGWRPFVEHVREGVRASTAASTGATALPVAKVR
ncbi:radical SAM protein [Micromonospora sp. NPDC049048]|uniref:radical SAM protein n=1 Tax=Micromonospora sp. NPDC049048 TaxID=3364263 RepID=UPI0037121D83